MSNTKAVFRLTAQKVLSPNAEAPSNVENIMVDVAAKFKFSRDELEGFVVGVLDYITSPLERALAIFGLTLDKIDNAELTGGTARIPAAHKYP